MSCLLARKDCLPLMELPDMPGWLDWPDWVPDEVVGSFCAEAAKASSAHTMQLNVVFSNTDFIFVFA